MHAGQAQLGRQGWTVCMLSWAGRDGLCACSAGQAGACTSGVWRTLCLVLPNSYLFEFMTGQGSHVPIHANADPSPWGPCRRKHRSSPCLTQTIDHLPSFLPSFQAQLSHTGSDTYSCCVLFISESGIHNLSMHCHVGTQHAPRGAFVCGAFVCGAFVCAALVCVAALPRLRGS